jgi:hypothetical protein
MREWIKINFENGVYDKIKFDLANMLQKEKNDKTKYYNEADCEGTPLDYWVKVSKQNWVRIKQLNDPCPRCKTWNHYLNYNFLYSIVPEGVHYLNPPFSRFPVAWLWLLLQHSTEQRSFTVLSTEKRCNDKSFKEYYRPNIEARRINGICFKGYKKDLAASLRQVDLWSPDHIDYTEHMNMLRNQGKVNM